MTCIVWVDNNKVYIGADSAGSGGWQIVTRIDTKVFKIWDFIFWCTTSFRMINILKYSFIPPKIRNTEDIYEYMCTKFINELRNSFGDWWFLEKDKNV